MHIPTVDHREHETILAVPRHLARYADEVDRWHDEALAARAARALDQ